MCYISPSREVPIWQVVIGEYMKFILFFALLSLSSLNVIARSDMFPVSDQAKNIVAALSKTDMVSVQLPINPLSTDKTPYNTFVTGNVMMCMTHLDQQLMVDSNQSYVQLLSEAIDPEYGIVTTAAKQFHLSLDDVLLVEAFTDAYYYGPVNTALRSGDLKDYACYIDGLKTSLKKFPEYRGTVIRGTDLPANVLAEHVPGSVVTYKAFTSATIGLLLTENFQDQPVVIKIRSKHGHDISSLNDEEGEVIFLPGTRFRVVSRKDAAGDNQVTNITLQEID
jgi:hypothetical protein